MNRRIKDNMDLLKDIIKFSIVLLIIVASISLKFFWNNDGIDYETWIPLVVTFAGSLIGGIFTMLGVVFTLNKSINLEEERKKDELNKLALIIYSEVKAYADSIKEYNLDCIRLKLLKRLIDNNEFEDIANKYDYRDKLYYISPNIREMFYEVIRFDYDENILQYFIKLCDSEEKCKKYYKDNIECSNQKYLRKASLVWLSAGFNEYRMEVFEGFNKANDNISYNKEESNKYAISLNEQLDSFEDNIFSNELIYVLDYLKKIIDSEREV